MQYIQYIHNVYNVYNIYNAYDMYNIFILPQRSIETIALFDQWSKTIEN